MKIWIGTCEDKHDYCYNRTQLSGYLWRRYHLGLVKLWLGYEIYNLITPNTKTLIKTNEGKTYYGKFLNQIELKWAWK